jgi:hypothetical protein
MAVRSCRVTIQDTDGVSHTVDVTAASFPYMKLAQGLASFRGNEWIADVGERFGTLKVSVAELRVEHEVKLKDFTAWLERSGKSPQSTVRKSELYSACQWRAESGGVVPEVLSA